MKIDKRTIMYVKFSLGHYFFVTSPFDRLLIVFSEKINKYRQVCWDLTFIPFMLHDHPFLKLGLSVQESESF